MTDAKTARLVLEAALETGGDFSELYLEDKQSNLISMVDGKVEDAGYTHAHGAGVRVLSGSNCAYAYTADTSQKALIETAKAAAAALKGKKTRGVSDFETPRHYSCPQEIPVSSVKNDLRIDMMKRGTAAVKAYSPEITQVTSSVADVMQRVCIINSDGVWACDERPRVRFVISAVATKDCEAQTGREGPGRGCGYEAFSKDVDIEACSTQAAKTAVTMLHAPQCPSGLVPVVIDGGFGGVILHEACVHSLEATSVAKGNSEFCGKLGTKVASDIVTAIDDGTLAGEWGTIRIDDEGMPAQKNVLIENGILKSYLVDKLGGRIMGQAPTGSSRRQGYEFAPTSRMTNTFFAPGKDDAEEMIRTMGTGLFAARMGGGSVNPLTGEFNFAVLEGYWVKDGKIYSPVRGATLIGKGTEVLLKIDRIADRMWMGQGMCGSYSGLVPTNVGQPRIRVSAITVGGKGGAL